MVIDLNKAKYENGIITTEKILKHFTSREIFNHYVPGFIVNAKMSSPLRKDNNPSFSIFQPKNKSILLYKDFATGDVGNAFKFVQYLYPGYTYNDALTRVGIDMGLKDTYICEFNQEHKGNIISPRAQKPPKNISAKQDVVIKFKLRSWRSHDLLYWSKFGITKDTLNKYRVAPISHYFFQKEDGDYRSVKAMTFAYVFLENKDDKKTFKIYQPYGDSGSKDKHKKWLTNHSGLIHQGYDQLPKSGNIMLITKSLKDVMSLHEVASIPAIGVQSEHYVIREKVVDEYITRFQYVMVLFDNDLAGKVGAIVYNKLYSLPIITLPKINEVDDFSSLVKEKGASKASRLLHTLVNKNMKMNDPLTPF